MADEFAPIDWAGIRDIVRAPAYYKHAAALFDYGVQRGENLDERAERLRAMREGQIKAQGKRG